MKNRGQSEMLRWVRRGFLLWALISTLWLINSVRTQGVGDDMLRSDREISVENGPTTLVFLPASSDSKTALIFICGSGISANAYAPLLRPIADAGFPVFVVKLPYRFAPLESHKEAAIGRARSVIAAHPEISSWVISGHSLGGAIACRVTKSDPNAISAMVLIGTTHPKLDDLSFLSIPVTKVYASNDGIATPSQILANKGLLPKHTRWLEIKGGNHSQFGHYGHQIFDGKATVSREAQQTLTRSALLEALANLVR